MNQAYAEAGVKRKDDTATIGIRILLILGILLGVFIIVFGGIFRLVGAVLIFLIIYLFPRLNVEYEYVFVDGQLDFDKIMGKAKRKNVLRIDFEQVEIMAPIHSHALDAYRQINCIVRDFTSGNKDANIYIIVTGVDEKKTKILFEPSEKMIQCIKQKSPRKVAL